VRGFITQHADGEFTPEVVSILEDAFEDAWRRVEASKAPYGIDEYAAAGRIIIAKYIIKHAKAGERDPRWLADSALLYLAQQKLSRTPPKDMVTGLFSLLLVLPDDLLNAVAPWIDALMATG
jgi:hypothetical protein